MTRQPGGATTTYAYDLGGRRASATDALGRTVRYVYDDYGRLESVVDASGVTRYGYDVQSNLVSLTDAEGRTTRFEYDAMRNRSKTIFPDGSSEQAAYDIQDRLWTRTDRRGVTMGYGYDDVDRLIEKTYSDGSAPVSFDYDNTDRLVLVSNGTDTLSWTYDLAGRTLSESSARNGSTLSYVYNRDGSRDTVSLDGLTHLAYGYDTAGRLSGLTHGAQVFGLGYDATSTRTSLSFPNGIVTTNGYDGPGRLNEITARLTGTVIAQSLYALDAVDNRTSKTHPEYGETYGHDALDRLLSVERTGLPGDRLYSYDAVGNRLSEQAGNRLVRGTYDERNELLGLSGGGKLHFRGVLDEPGAVSVAGQPARRLAGNGFEAEVDVVPGPNDIVVQATDVNGNVATAHYQVDVTGDGATFRYDPNGNLVEKVERTGRRGATSGTPRTSSCA